MGDNSLIERFRFMEASMMMYNINVHDLVSSLLVEASLSLYILVKSSNNDFGL